MSVKEIKNFLNKDISPFFQKEKKKKVQDIVLMVLIAFLVGGFIGGKYGDEIVYGMKYIGTVINNSLGIFPKIELPSRSIVSHTPTQPSTSSSSYVPQTTQEAQIIKVVKEVSPAVVSIVITKDLPVYEKYYEYENPFEEFFGEDIPFFEFKIPHYRQKGTKKQKVGGGTGFIISKDGMIITNKHVVADPEAEYTVITIDGKKYPAKVLAKDPFQDLAFLKIEREKKIDKKGNLTLPPFPVVKLGDSSNLQIGQTVIAIGNALGEFRNTVSVGVISGLGRTITASGGGIIETLEDVIQTDAAINRGNSGGPLLNLKGEVIGVNVAMAQGAQNIGFAIPINKAKRDIEQVRKTGEIVYPFLGVRYVLITPEIQEERNLPVDYGALIIKGSEKEPGVVPGSAAEKAGLKEGDIILEVDGQKITPRNSLGKIIRAHLPGDKITLKILRENKKKILKAVLGRKSSKEQ